MAGYVKIWTFIEDEDWFQDLSGLARNLLFHVLIHAKKGADNGHVAYSSYLDLAHRVSISRSTCVRVVSELVQKRIVECSKINSGRISLFVRNYMKWQDMTVTQAVHYKRHDDSNLNHNIAPTRPDQTRPEQTRPEQTSDSAHPPCPIQEIMGLFNTTCTSLPQIKSVEGTRLKHLQSRWRQKPDLEFWSQFFVTVEVSNFLTGRLKDWTASFDWIIKPTNFTKILEGNYVNKQTDGMNERDRRNAAQCMAWLKNSK
jgi:hypothetical protein